MTLRSTTEQWGALSRIFHWGMFVVYGAIVAVGYYMSDLPLGPDKMKIYALHKSFGIAVLALAVLRLLWRFVDRRPASDPMPAWQRLAALGAVVALYVLMFAMPLSGWIYNSAAGFPLQWFHLVNLPALVAPNPALKSFAKEFHETGAVIFLVVIGVHAAAAFKHHFIDRDRTLLRMLPPRGRKSE